MDRFAIGVLAVAFGTVASCTLSREGTLPVEATGGAGGVTSSGDGGTTSGTSGAGGGPSCGLGFECVPEATDGQLVRLGFCPTGWQDDSSFYDGNNPGCGPCGCNPATGGYCEPGAVTRYEETDCQDQMGGSLTSSDESCIPVPMDDDDQAGSYEVAPSTATGGSCEPMTPAKPTLEQVFICGLEHPITGGCPSGEICVPTGNGDTGSVCVLLEGSESCPAGYPNPSTLYLTANDTRECACTCGPPSGACPGSEIILHNHQNCQGGQEGTVPADGNCHDVAGANGHDSYEVEAGTWSGACAPSDAHTGDVDWGGDHTLCCP
ncbi:MAG: hypothetical protein JRI68_11650 [Deltaproteobacteria bacterium]|nr:hypothetical protein [Deltaproteobacteria bacterium]